MLKGITIEYYGTPTPLSQVSSINTPDGRTITVQPWEKSLLSEIEKGILNANLGFNPMNNGESIIINVPPLTEERRIELVKLAKIETENTKVSIRNARKDANNEIKKSESSEDLQKNAEIDIQELTDNYIIKVDNIFSSKEKEILTV
jgi:ribosome recycling factor